MINLPSTYEEFVWHFVSTLRKGFKWLDIFADIYRANSIKDGEKNTSGSSQRVIIASSKSRLTHDVFELLKNGEKKTRVTEIVSEVLRNNFSNALVKLRSSMVYISQEDVTYCIAETGATINQELSSNQDEADTKVILY